LATTFATYIRDRINAVEFLSFLQDQRKFRSELLALEDELCDKEERLRTAIATRQEFAGQLVSAQQRELAILAENAKLIETQVSS